jgi:phage shock protein PspC (stress-responsive transcriptional regulator)
MSTLPRQVMLAQATIREPAQRPRTDPDRVGDVSGTSPMAGQPPVSNDPSVAESNDRTFGEAVTAPRRERIVRPIEGRLLAGVASGIADRLAVGPTWIRLAFVVLSFGAGAGLLLYLALWWLLPREDMPTSGSEEFLRRFPDAPAWTGRVLLIVGGAVLALQIAPDDRRGWSLPLVLGVGLVAFGVALFRRDLARTGEPRAHADPPVAPELIDTGSVPPLASAPARVRPPRERSRLGVLTAGSAMIAVSAAVLLDGLGAITLDVGRFPALALVVLGIGLLVGAWWGRARGAIVLGVLVLPVALVLSLIHLPFGVEIASRALSPRRDDPFPSSQRLLAGELFIDLTRVDLQGRSRTLDIELGAGAVHLIVPREVNVHLVAEVGMGGLRVTGYPDRYGVDLLRDVALPGSPGGGVLTINVDQGIGSVDLDRPPPERKVQAA